MRLAAAEGVAAIRAWLQGLAKAAENPAATCLVPRTPPGLSYLPERPPDQPLVIAQGSAQPLTQQTVERAIGDYLRGRSPNTRRAAIADLANFFAWCVATNRTPLPPDAIAVKFYVKARAGEGGAGIKPSSVTRALGTLGTILNNLQVPDVTKSPTVINELAAARNLAKKEKRSVRQHSLAIRWSGKHGIRAWLERRHGDETPTERLRRLRAEAMILVGFWGALRVSELVAVEVEHLHPNEEGGATLYLYDSKTHTAGETMVRQLPRRALQAINAWQEAAGITEGHLFRGFDLNGQLRPTGMSTTAANAIIKAAADEMGVNLAAAGGRSTMPLHVRRASSHGLRIGFVQEALEKDISAEKIVLAGGWANASMVVEYGRELKSKKAGSAELAKILGES